MIGILKGINQAGDFCFDTKIHKQIKKSGFAAPGGCLFGVAGRPAALTGHPAGVAGHPFAVAGCPAALKGCPAGVAGHPFAVVGCPAAPKVRSAGAIKPTIFSINAYYQQHKY